jgi:hypothetical protein
VVINLIFLIDGSTFSIWGFIYLFQTAFVIYQALPSNHQDSTLSAVRLLVASIFLVNTLWLFAFAYYLWWVSLLLMLAYLVLLIRLYNSLNVNYGLDSNISGAPVSKIFKCCVFTGFSINVAWIAVASGVNATLTLRTEGWQSTYGTGGSAQWAVMWVCIFTLVACYVAIARCDFAYAFATAWALGGIYRMQTVEDATRFPPEDMNGELASFAMAGLILSAIFGVIGIITAVISKPPTDSPNQRARVALVDALVS